MSLFSLTMLQFIFFAETETSANPFFTNDAVVLGLLLLILAGIFYTNSLKSNFWQTFYRYIPALLLCYFLPALLNWPLNLANGGVSKLYFVASRYLLPASLVLLCLAIDFKGVIRLGPKALIMFFAATLGIIIGGPIAILTVKFLAPNLIPVSMEDLWRGMSTIAGSWIGGGANQTAMKELYLTPDGNLPIGEFNALQEKFNALFGTMVIVDVIVANIWMAFLLYGANVKDKIDGFLKADNSLIQDLEQRMENYSESVKKVPSTTDLMVLFGVVFFAVALSHWGADTFGPFFSKHKELLKRFRLETLASGFFWLIVISTTIGVGLSFTKFRRMEGVGATKFGSVFIYILVATIGLQMNLAEVFQNLGLFAIGLVWMLIHVSILLLVAKLIKAPFFFVAVGSQANVGGAASAPIVASAFNPSLASVGALMAVLGYALGTFGAIICATLMQIAAGG